MVDTVVDVRPLCCLVLACCLWLASITHGALLMVQFSMLFAASRPDANAAAADAALLPSAIPAGPLS